jgi:vancomycin resistance protein YoaR
MTMQTGSGARRGSARGGSASSRARPSGRPRASVRALWAATIVGIVVIVVSLAIVVDAAVYYGKVHAGVSVAGVDLGGHTRAEATAALSAAVRSAQAEPLVVSGGDRTWRLSAEDAGAALDVDAAVGAAMALTREHGVFADIALRWKLFFSERDLPLEGTVDEASLGSFVAAVAVKLDVSPVNAGLSIKGGRIEAIESVGGRVVDRDRLAASLKAELVGLRTGVVQVPMVSKEPEVTAEDNAEAREQAEAMISGPVTISGGGESWTLTADQIASCMSFRSQKIEGVSTLVPYLDATKLQSFFNDIAAAVRQKPKDASFAHDASHAWVVAGKNGKQLDAGATAEAVTAVALKTTGRAVTALTTDLEPDFTTAEAKAMGISDKLSSCTTKHPCSTARQVNVKLATKYGTNVFLAPGEEYDFDTQIGPRTESRGWRKATGIVGPNQLEDVWGGGICQVSTTMFNAVADKKAGLEILERHCHSLFLSHYPLGRDATVTGGGKNLRFANDMDHYVWITGESNGVTTTITIWGTDQGRSTKWTVGAFYDRVPITKTSVTDPTLAKGTTSLLSDGQEGRSLKTTRVVAEDGAVIHRNVWINHWEMYPEEIAVGTATTSTTHPPVTARTTTTTAPAKPTTSTTATTAPASG